MTEKPSFYITTAISYPNGDPHIGHAYEAIATDAIARFKRLDGYDVFFLTGVDEHGLKMKQTAAKAGHQPGRARRAQHAALPRHGRGAEHLQRRFHPHHRAAPSRRRRRIWRRMEDNGDIYLDAYAGWYSVRDEAFYAEDETTLREDGVRVGPQGTPVEWTEEQTYFFRLSDYQDKLLRHYEDNPDFILPPERRNEIVSFVKSGLKDLSVSRTTLDWGIPVPDAPGHIIYVWVDALTNYITGVGYPDEQSAEFQKYWPADIHMIGKDITRFHAVYWPAFLMSAGSAGAEAGLLAWLPAMCGARRCRSRSAMSSIPFAMAERYGVDQMRYFFLREVPFGQDGSYSHEAIVNRTNADLANDLGNLAQRSLSMIAKNCDGRDPRARRLYGGRQALLAAADGLARHSARSDGAAGAAPGAGGDLASGCRRQPLFRRRTALGAEEDRSGAHGHGALCHGRSAAAGRHSGAALHSGVGGKAARPACADGRAGLRPARRRRTD